MSDNFYLDNDDLRFHIEKRIDWETLIEATEYGAAADDRPASTAEARETYEDVLREMGKFCARSVAPVARAIDSEAAELIDGEVRESPSFTKVFKSLKKLQVYGLPVPRELGGLNAPALVYLGASEVMARAEVSCMTHFGFHTGVAMSLITYALRDPATKVVGGRLVETPYDHEILEMISGKEWGCMVLTEPGAGSDLSAIRTTAVIDEAGVWRLNGEKIFITSGHGKYQLVLARTEDAVKVPGLKGLSLFLVERSSKVNGVVVENVRIAKVEHKIGHRGSPTCSLIYENSNGRLIGKRGEGFELMLVLMNFARIAVGFEGLGIMEAATRLAKNYAAERVTMGKTIDRHEMIADFLEDMDLWTRGVRSLLFRAGHVTELSQRWEQILKFDPPADAEARAKLERKVKRLKREARNLTPLCKYAGSEKAVDLARLSMQVLGGAGYTTEWEAEKLLRDALVLPIYEGTSQIQSLMALKDQLMAALQNPQKFLTKVARANVNRLTAKEPLERQLSRLYAHKYSALQTILVRIASKKLQKTRVMPVGTWTDALFSQWDPKLDFAPGLLHAERLCRILVDVEIARSLVDDAELFAERRWIAERFMARADRRCRALLVEIEEHGSELLADLAVRNAADAEALGDAAVAA
jgi:3-(methylthio)propanoyl-CoA dehydrogenase